MLSITQESVKLAFCMRIPGVCRAQGIFFLYFCNKLPFWRPFCLNSYFILYFVISLVSSTRFQRHS